MRPIVKAALPERDNAVRRWYFTYDTSDTSATWFSPVNTVPLMITYRCHADG